MASQHASPLLSGTGPLRIHTPSRTASPLLGSSPLRDVFQKDEEAGLPPNDESELGFEMDDHTKEEDGQRPRWLQPTPEDEEGSTRVPLRQRLADYSCVMLNVLSTIAIVFINKM